MNFNKQWKSRVPGFVPPNVLVCFGISVKEVGLPKENGGGCLPRHAVVLFIRATGVTCHVRDFTCPNSGAYLRFLYFYLAWVLWLCACWCVRTAFVGSWLLLFVCPDLSGTASRPAVCTMISHTVSWLFCSGLAHLSSLARNSYLWQVDKWICCLLSHVNLFFIERWDSGRVICPKNTTAVILLSHLQISAFFLHLGVPHWWACYGSEGARCFLCLSMQF